MSSLSDIFALLAKGKATTELPQDMEQAIISKMIDGEVGYTVPWAMFADTSRKLYIVGTYTVFHEICGTVHMKIKRSGESIIVDKSSIKNDKFSPGEPCYVGVTPDKYIPVILVDRF